tara:strand:+ start:343 stop:516 length:174 start_codon:yes stop_codon:yes gene_type:complete
MAVLFLVLSIISLIATVSASQWGGLIPILIFFIVSFVCMIVGFLGNDQAVAKIWGSK